MPLKGQKEHPVVSGIPHHPVIKKQCFVFLSLSGHTREVQRQKKIESNLNFKPLQFSG